MKILRQSNKGKPIIGHQLPPRNAPCPCGSTKKYKKCCYQKLDLQFNKPESTPAPAQP